MARFIADGDKVASAGLAASNGAPLSRHADTALREIGLSPPPRGAKPLTPEIVDWADIVLCMEEYHKQSILLDYPSSTSKIKTLAEWAGDPGRDIEDPYGGTLATYREVRDEITKLIQKGLHA